LKVTALVYLTAVIYLKRFNIVTNYTLVLRIKLHIFQNIL